MDPEIIKALSYVKLSKHRINVMSSIGNKIKRPGEIAKDKNMVLSDVSRALRGLKEKKLVICLNEEVKQGRLYKITDLGKEVLEHI